MTGVMRTALVHSQLLRHLTSDGLESVAKVAVKRTYQEGATIFSAGDPGDAIFGVVTGHVHITARSSRHQEIILDVAGPNEVFGELGVIDGLPRGASARAATGVGVFAICRVNFTRLMLADPMLSLGLLDVLCRHQRFATELIIAEYAQGNIPARLAHRVLQLTVANGADGNPDRSLRITQADLAKLIFVSRQVVNQHLSEWQAHGWVSTSRRCLVVRDRDALEGVARNRGNGSSLD